MTYFIHQCIATWNIYLGGLSSYNIMINYMRKYEEESKREGTLRITVVQP